MINNPRPDCPYTTADFYYDLPEGLIAQTPAEPRDSSRLMVLNRADGSLTHRTFRDVTEYLQKGDLLVINDSRVIPARMYGVKEESGIEIEVVLLKDRGLDEWECLVRPGRRCKPGTVIIFGNGLLRATVKESTPEGNRIITFEYDKGGENFFSLLDRVGQMPLPPYITEKLKDRDRYQTVYAKERGSAAAPTAGLHFTTELLEKIKGMGVEVVPVMLHVGLGTFRPVKVEKVTEHVMHTEYFSVSKEAADKINAAKKEGRRVICVGTTSCRTVESAATAKGEISATSGETGIFIYPGYDFKIVDALITNFHLPESTLLMLVSALADRDTVLDAYKTAVKEQYRFFSFGDAMLIV
jgi:S-adenosylmethionine:tRNA ribosyltransferase-isomerase